MHQMLTHHRSHVKAASDYKAKKKSAIVVARRKVLMGGMMKACDRRSNLIGRRR